MQVLPDVAGARAAFHVRDAAWFVEIGARLGVELALPPLAAYLGRFAEREREQLAAVLMRLLAAALASASGYGFEHVTSGRVHTCLVARGEGRVVLGVQPSFRRTPFPNPGWKIRRWFDEPARNATAAAAWAREPARDADALAFALVPPPEAEVLARGRALLAAVVASPADDDPRRIYADWLLERGDLRGELIQLQCELARGALRDPRRREIRTRERQLVASNRALIGGDLASHAHGVVIRRGLVDSVTIVLSRLVRYASDDAWRTFLASVDAPRLRALHFDDTELGPPVLELLARETTLPAVESLRICYRAIPSAGDPVELVRRLAMRGGLRALGLVRCSIDARTMDRVAISVLAHAHELAELVFSWNSQLGQVPAILADALADRRLDRLELLGNDVTIDDVAALVRAPGFANLGELVIQPWARSDADLDLLADALIASAGATRVNWHGLSRLPPERIAALLAQRDVVYARDDGSLDLIDR